MEPTTNKNLDLGLVDPDVCKNSYDTNMIIGSANHYNDLRSDSTKYDNGVLTPISECNIRFQYYHPPNELIWGIKEQHEISTENISVPTRETN